MDRGAATREENQTPKSSPTALIDAFAEEGERGAKGRLRMPLTQTRRRFLTALSLAGATSLLRTPYVLAAEGVPETTTVRILKLPSICVAPQYVADELLGAEGFTDIGYVDAAGSESSAMVGRGEADFTLEFAAQTIQTIEAGAAVTILSGVHVGCYELFAKNEIRSVNVEQPLNNATTGPQWLPAAPANP
jgi:NitT/TauT family transport system substrate-binding protein